MTPLQDSFKQETKPQAIRSLLDSRPSPGDKLTLNMRFSGNFQEKNNTCNLSEHKSILEQATGAKLSIDNNLKGHTTIDQSKLQNLNVSKCKSKRSESIGSVFDRLNQNQQNWT